MRARRLAALTGVIAIAAVPVASALRASPTHRPHRVSVRTRAAQATRSLATLPLLARGPIAAALGRSDRAYWVRDRRSVNRAQRLQTTFEPRGVSVASGRVRFGLSLVAYGRTGQLATVRAAVRRASANRVTYVRGAIREWYANGPLGLEQGFDLTRPPAGVLGAASRPLTLALALGGDVSGRLDHDSVLLSAGGATLRYGGLVATDARGRALRAWLEFANRRIAIRVDDHAARYPLHVDPLVQQAVLTAADGADNDQFGQSVAVSGDTVLVGARLHTVDDHALQGTVYVFERPASGWADTSVPTAELTLRDGAAGDELGSSVAISGDTVVAASAERNQERGAAYVFVRPASGWVSTNVPTATLTVGNGLPGDALGTSLAVAADTIVAGATRRVSGAGRGTAYVFTKPPGGWTTTNAPAAQLFPPDSELNDGFGASAAVTGDTVVVGTPHRTVGANPSQGAVYVYVKGPSGWNGFPAPTAELTAGTGSASDRLGAAVAASGDTIAAGAPGPESGSNLRSGAAYLFLEPVGGWTSTNVPTAAFSVSDGQPGDLFGAAVAASGDTVLVGAPGRKVGNNPSQGAAFAFSKPSAGWVSTDRPSETLTASDGQAFGQLGAALALSGETLALGAPGHATGIRQSVGAAYVLAPPPPTITITSPRDGASYSQGQLVTALFACADSGGSGLATCTGTSAAGAPIDTTTLGAHAFSVTATDVGGEQATRTVTYTVTLSRACPPGQLGTAPHCLAPLRISRVTQAHRTWREGTRRAAISRRRRRVPVGTKFAFTLSTGARVSLRFTRAATHAPIGTLTFRAQRGRRSVHFDGVLAPKRRLRPGRYAVTLSAQSGSQRATARAMTFVIVP